MLHFFKTNFLRCFAGKLPGGRSCGCQQTPPHYVEVSKDVLKQLKRKPDLRHRVIRIDGGVVGKNAKSRVAEGTTTVAAILRHGGYDVRRENIKKGWCDGGKQLTPGAIFGYKYADGLEPFDMKDVDGWLGELGDDRASPSPQQNGAGGSDAALSSEAPSGKRSASDPPEEDRSVAPGDAVGERALEQARNVVSELEGRMGVLTIEASLCPAAARGDIEAMERLLAAGVPVDKRGESGTTPLMVAANAGHVDAVQLLLSWGAEAMVEIGSQSPLTVALRGQHIRVVEMLLHHNLPPDLSMSFYSLGPLWYHLCDFVSRCSQTHHRDIWEALLETECKSRFAPFGILGIDCASLREQLKYVGVDLLQVLRATVDLNTELHKAANRSDLDTVKLLLDAGAEPNTELHKAAERADVDTVKLLLDAGAEPSALDGGGWAAQKKVLLSLHMEYHGECTLMDGTVLPVMSPPGFMERLYEVLRLLVPDAGPDLEIMVARAASTTNSKEAFLEEMTRVFSEGRVTVSEASFPFERQCAAASDTTPSPAIAGEQSPTDE